ncbi:MAG: gliding motility protein GldM [Cyclobacteriaceae bacterium]|jgi:gliding motility-associated protein GldM|nr:gliding motility protein GldM [Cytophagales bacterium]MCZ8328958.1 gliding motility protein GldM [Cyclobacteriaceae bacterium]
MAGGKETPRQKLIGMMYLVLTALLALQVSSAVLEKFAIIHATLDGLIADGNTKNQATLDHLIEEAGKNQNPKVLKAKVNAGKVREATKSTLAGIESLKKAMMETSGTDKIDDKFINDHSSKVATMMIDSRSPHGVGFEKLLNDYVKQISDLSGIKFEKLTKSPDEIEMFKGNEKHANKDFRTFMFENTPPIAALASVTQIQTEVLEYESKALAKLSEDANVGTIRFDKFVPMVLPKSQVVVAGTKYEAEMFISGAASAVTPEFYRDGSKLLNATSDAGIPIGKVEFVASGGAYDKATGLAKKSFKAEIKLADTTFSRNIDYFVAEPVIKVTTGNAPRLYLNCGNAVTFEVSGLGPAFNPSFSSNGAEVQKGDKAGVTTIIPSQRKFAVSVANGGANLGSVNFEAKPIPRPRFIAKDATGRDIDPKQGIRANSPQIKVNAEAEANFKDEVPKDANFRIRQMNILLNRGGNAVATLSNYTSEIVDLKGLGQLRAGDVIIVELRQVVRKTYKGTDESVPTTAQDFILIPVK